MYAIKENQTPFIPVLSDEGFLAVELIISIRKTEGGEFTLCIA